jgi:hypothetical protein
MNTQELLRTMDELVDEGTDIAIKLGRIDPHLSEQLFQLQQKWRSLFHVAANIPDEDLETLNRYFQRKDQGE